MADLQMLPLHTKVTWSGRDDMVPIEHRGSRREARSVVSPRRGVAERFGAVGPAGTDVGRVVDGAVGGRWDGVTMTTTAHPYATGTSAPEALESRFAACVAAGDLDGIVGLYAADAVVSLPRGREAAGSAAIRSAFAAALAAGVLGAYGESVSARAVVTGGLAMTTSTTADGTVHTQVARRTADGRWVWVRDGSRLREVEACLPAPTDDLAVA
jgi:ketosteroid isomerase-like protein